MPSRSPGGKKRRRRDPNELREEALRPSPYLGHDRVRLAAYLMSRGAFGVAEPQLRRSIWLNPFEPAFKQLLAWCLYKQARHAEAWDWTVQALDQNPGDPDTLRVAKLIAGTGPSTGGLLPGPPRSEPPAKRADTQGTPSSSSDGATEHDR